MNYVQMANTHKKGCPISHIIRKFQIKTIIRTHKIPIRMAKIQDSDTKRLGGCVVQEYSFVASGSTRWCHLLRVRQVFTKLSIFLLYNPAIMFLGVCPNQLKIYILTHKKMNLNLYVYIIFLYNVKTWNQWRHPSTGTWVNRGTSV